MFNCYLSFELYKKGKVINNKIVLVGSWKVKVLFKERISLEWCWGKDGDGEGG